MSTKSFSVLLVFHDALSFFCHFSMSKPMHAFFYAEPNSREKCEKSFKIHGFAQSVLFFGDFA